MKFKLFVVCFLLSISILKAEIISHHHTIHLRTCEDIYKNYQIQTALYPAHVSFVTGQAEKFLIYELVARAIYQKFHAKNLTKQQLANRLFIRYPQKGSPKNLTEFFSNFNLMENFDTASHEVAKHLLSFSPSLKEDERDESALAIFKSNDRHQECFSFIADIFKQEHVSKKIYGKKLKKLIKEFPQTKKGGIITQVFLSKTAPLSQVLYHSLEYGIPYSMQECVHQFFEDYSAGKVWEDNPVPQLRFLPSALSVENGFDLDDIYMIRYTLMDAESLNSFTTKVNRFARQVFKAHREEMLEFEVHRQKILSLLDEKTRDEGLVGLIGFYLSHFNYSAALEHANMMQDSQFKNDCIPYILIHLLGESDWQIAEQQILEHQHFFDLEHKNKLLANLCMRYCEFGQVEKIKSLMAEFPSSCEKNFLAIYCSAIFPQESEFFSSQLSNEFLQDFDTLIEMNVLVIEKPEHLIF